MTRVIGDNLHKLEIWWLKQQRYIPGWRQGTVRWVIGDRRSSVELESSVFGDNNHIRVSYGINNDAIREPYDYNINLTSTRCNYGGKRYWFLCPSCNLRVGVLYFRFCKFLCRFCANITYESKTASGKWKKVGKVVSAPFLDKVGDDVKRPFYSGRPTRKYLRFLHYRQKFFKAISTFNSLYGRPQTS